MKIVSQGLPSMVVITKRCLVASSHVHGGVFCLGLIELTNPAAQIQSALLADAVDRVVSFTPPLKNT